MLPRDASGSAPYSPVKSADRTLDVLEALAAADVPLPLGELSRELGIPKSSLHGILRTLTQRRWVETDETGVRFRIGIRALLIGASYLHSSDAVAQAQTVLDWLSANLHEAVHLGRLDGSDVVYLAKRESAYALRLFSSIGRRLPAHATALGKSLLAQRSDEVVDALLKWPLPALTQHTITDRDALFAELATIRSRGYAEDNGENADGIRCLAVHLDTASPPQDAISLSIPVFRLDAELESRAIALLGEAKQRIEDTYRLARAR